MRTVLYLSLLGAGLGAWAQSVETIPYRAGLSARNETTPVVDANATGSAIVWLHLVRDASGRVTSGSIDFNVSYRMSGPTTFTAMHIHRAPAGVAGGVVIPVPLARFDDATGSGTLSQRQVQFTSADTGVLDAVNGILADPSGYYFNLHSADAPSGAIRGQLQRAEMTVLMGLMSPANEVQPIQGSSASAVATVVALRTLDANSVLTWASVIFDVTYTGFPEGTSFTGLHIHFGNAGFNGPVTLNSGISNQAQVAAGAGGSGNLRYEFDANLGLNLAPETVNALFERPQGTYINLHTTVSPGGAVRAQLTRADHAGIQVTATPREEVVTPPLTIEASAPAAIHVYTLRNQDGSVPAGTVIFDINPRFPAGSVLTAMHIHDGVAGVNGGVTIDGRLASAPLLAEGGTGNIWRIVPVVSATAVASLNSLVRSPERHYFNLHTAVNQAGAVRAQLGLAGPAPLVTAAISAVSDITRTTAANKSLMSVYGQRLAKLPGTLDGFPQLDALPKSLNGVSATIGGTEAGLVAVSPEQVILEVPAEVAEGNQPLVVTSSSGASNSFQLPVRAISPNIFFDAAGGIITKADFSLVRPGNPASAGDVLAIFSTGNGQTTPPLNTARIPPLSPLFHATPPTVTIGGRDAEVLYSVAAPGFPGLYQTGVRMPSGVAAGRAPVQMVVAGAASNAVMIDVR
jgi:uncharacterized protein (TIGR03437 family)